jgi:hydrogenase maturation factor
MMEGTPVYTGRLVGVSEGPRGRVGRLSVRGARVEVVLDLVPEAATGDEVLAHAGVALAVVRDALKTPDGKRGG